MIAMRILTVLASVGLCACGWNGDEPDLSQVIQLEKTAYGDSTANASALSVAPLPHTRGFVAAWDAQYMDLAPPRTRLAIVETDSLGNQISAWNAMGGKSIGYFDPHVAGLPGGGYVVAWYSSGPSAVQGNAHFQIVGNGHGTGNPVRLDFPGFLYVNSVAVAAMPDTGFVLAIAGYDSVGESCIRVQRYDPVGKPSGPLNRIFSGRDTGKPGIIDLESGGWMLAWKTLDSTGMIMGWQAFSGNGEPAGESRNGKIGVWNADLKMRKFPGGRIYLDAGETGKGKIMDAQGMPDPKYDPLTRYHHGLTADSSRGRLYGLDYEKISAFDSEARLLGSRRTRAAYGWLQGQLFLNTQGNLVLFSVEYTQGSTDNGRAFIQSLVMKPF